MGLEDPRCGEGACLAGENPSISCARLLLPGRLSGPALERSSGEKGSYPTSFPRSSSSSGTMSLRPKRDRSNGSVLYLSCRWLRLP